MSFAKADETEVGLGGQQSGNIRYARNAVSTAGEVSNLNLSVSSSFGKKRAMLRSMNLMMHRSKK
ncbi:hypothetical protein [Paraflavitalea speifideaquila]|uniref:hypothetical protein n=1 Tax=Paraflavitalea speifideaquila TaxID=3076558 RepID=UPI0028E79542|nr:hypothetical protein [Paraflavitalea speifideiaquila]